MAAVERLEEVADLSDEISSMVDLRRKRRWPFVVGLLLFVWLCFAWSVSSPAVFSTRVGSGVELRDDVFAVIRVFRTPAETSFIAKVGELFGMTGSEKSFVIFDDGSVTVVGDSELGEYVLASARPMGWFLPFVDGAVYYGNGGHAEVRPLFVGANGAHASIGEDSDESPMAVGLLPDAVFASHVVCDDDCNTLLRDVFDVGFSGGVEFDQQIISVNGGIETLFFFYDDYRGDAEMFVERVSAIRNPISKSRDIDGVVVDELFVPDSVDRVLLSGSDVDVYRYGDDASVYMADFGDMRIVGFDEDVIMNTIIGLSTQLLTNDACGVPADSLYTLNFWPELGKNFDSSIKLVHSGAEWKICDESLLR